MARTANYDAKIATLTEKVEKKTAELKKLKEELSEIQSKKAKSCSTTCRQTISLLTMYLELLRNDLLKT